MRQQIVSFSGGKDSTAMLHMMLERGEDVAAVVFFDWGIEFEEMGPHLEEVERKTGIEIVRLYPEHPWRWYFFMPPVRSSRDRPEEGIVKGDIRGYGKGWPSLQRRWCTTIKVRAMAKWAKAYYPEGVHCIGFADDERHRRNGVTKIKESKRVRYPLIEYGVTEADALAYCLKLGYRWGGLYDVFDRVSCRLCPLGGIGKARLLRKHRPEVWREMMAYDACRPEHSCTYLGTLDAKTCADLDKRFEREDRVAADEARQGQLFATEAE